MVGGLPAHRFGPYNAGHAGHTNLPKGLTCPQCGRIYDKVTHNQKGCTREQCKYLRGKEWRARKQVKAGKC